MKTKSRWTELSRLEENELVQAERNRQADRLASSSSSRAWSDSTVDDGSSVCSGLISLNSFASGSAAFLRCPSRASILNFFAAATVATTCYKFTWLFSILWLYYLIILSDSSLWFYFWFYSLILFSDYSLWFYSLILFKDLWYIFW